MTRREAQTEPVPVEVKEVGVTRYAVECPTCDEWHESDESFAGKPPLECICGTFIKVARRAYL